MKVGDAVTLVCCDAPFDLPRLFWATTMPNVIGFAMALCARLGLRVAPALQAACCLQPGAVHCFKAGKSKASARASGLHLHVLS